MQEKGIKNRRNGDFFCVIKTGKKASFVCLECKQDGGVCWNRTNLNGFAVRHIANLSPRLLFCPGTCRIMPKDVGKSKCHMTGRETRYDLLRKSD